MSKIPDENDVPHIVDKHERYIEIYKITNTVSQKIYIGQAVSHILNHGKYRRYGAKKRLDSHISEAIKNNKDKQCRYLNNSIRKHGSDKFIVEIIDTCPMELNDETEAKYIIKYNSVFPFGYNLKIGGTIFKHSDESRRILSESYYRSKVKHDTVKVNIMNSIIQNKLDRLDDVELPEDIDNYEKYIRLANNKVKNLLIFKLGEIEISFGSKKKTIDQLKSDVANFIEKLKEYKKERINPAKLLDDPEKPHSYDNFADNNEHIASREEYVKSIEIYKEHLKQRKEKKKFNHICTKCNIQKTITDFRKHVRCCRECERENNRERDKRKREIKNASKIKE